MRSLRALLLVAALICLGGCNSRNQQGVAVAKEFRSYISSDAKALLNVDLAALEKSSFWQAHQDRFDLGRFSTVTSQIGLDPKQDISNLLAEWNGKSVLLLVHGRFDSDRIKNKLTGLNATKRQIAGKEIYGDKDSAFALVSSDLVIGGNKAAVETALHQISSSSMPDELKARLENVPQGSQIWVVSRGGLPFAEVPLRSDYESLLSNIIRYVRDTSLGISASSGLKFEGKIGCISLEGAQRVHDALRGAIGFGRLSTPDNEPQLLRAYDALHVNQSGSDVRLSADLPRDLADQLVMLLPR